MMPFTIWTERVIFIVNMVSFFTGIMIIGLSSFYRHLFKVLWSESATVAGFTLTAMSIGWPIASTLAGRFMQKIGFRMTALSGGFSLILGSLVLVLMNPKMDR